MPAQGAWPHARPPKPALPGYNAGHFVAHGDRMLYPLLRPLLFRTDAESAHETTLKMLDTAHQLQLTGLIARKVGRNPVKAMGLTFPNPIGLAAGLDKNGDHIDALAA